MEIGAVVDATVVWEAVVVGVPAVGFDERPRDVVVVVDDAVALVFVDDTGTSLDGVEARESLSLLPVLSGFFGLLATAIKLHKKKLYHLQMTTLHRCIIN